MRAIRLVPFGEVDPSLLVDLIDSLSVRLGGPVTRGGRQEVPAAALDPDRNQYLAGAFLERLRETAKEDGLKILGITAADIYSSGLNFVFGQADVGGQASIISLARLFPEASGGDGRVLLRERMLKEAVHELGHNFGLDHCRDRLCVMHFSNGIAETDIKTADFCPRHEAELKKGTDPFF